MARWYRCWIAGIGCVLATMPLLAHHAISAKFDPVRKRTLSGIVTKVDWANPHVHLLMNVSEGNRISNWAVELESVVDLERSGWKRDSVKPGEAITVQGIVARDGSPQIWGESVVVTATRRQVLAVSAEAMAALAPSRNAAPAKPAPRWPDGKPRLGPVPGESGYWGRPSSTLLVQSGARVDADANGLLKNIAEVDKVAPFQRWARDLFEYRQRNFLKDDPMYLACKPPGGPRQWEQIYGFQFVENPDFNRILVLLGGGNRNRRVIYTDGRKQEGQINGDADNPLYYGRSVAKWEGDTMVVDTKGFNEKFWMDSGGLPHTDQLHLIERFTRVDMKTMNYEVTIDDPGAYTRMWKSSWTFEWIPGEETPYFLCQDNRP